MPTTKSAVIFLRVGAISPPQNSGHAPASLGVNAVTPSNMNFKLRVTVQQIIEWPGTSSRRSSFGSTARNLLLSLRPCSSPLLWKHGWKVSTGQTIFQIASVSWPTSSLFGVIHFIHYKCASAVYVRAEDSYFEYMATFFPDHSLIFRERDKGVNFRASQQAIRKDRRRCAIIMVGQEVHKERGKHVSICVGLDGSVR